MWYSGNFAKPYDLVNPRLASIKGDLTRDQAHPLLFEFLQANLPFTYNLLTGGELFPFQTLKLNTMLKRDYIIDVSSRGLSKSYLAAIYCILYCYFNPNSKVILVSATFKQAKRIFEYIEEIIAGENATLLKEIWSHRKGADQWTGRLGTSTITALPLAIGGGKVRGYRAHCVIVDEALEFSDSVLREVIMPFLVAEKDAIKKQKIYEFEEELIKKGQLHPKDKIVFPNPKLILLSSACFEFQDFYSRFLSYIDYISKSEFKESQISYAVFNFSYQIAPKKLLSGAVVEDAKRSMSESEFDREYGANFTSDSSGYFSMKKMELCSEKISPVVEIIGEKGAEYILSVDPNHKDSENSDHFAMSVLKLSKDRKHAHLVHGYAMSGVSLDKTAHYAAYLLEYFNIVYVIFDSGGADHVLQFLNDSTIFKTKGLKLYPFDYDFSTDKPGSLIKARNSYNKTEGRIVHIQSFNSGWIRPANEFLQGSFEHKRIRFSAPATIDFEEIKDFDIPIENLVFDKEDYSEYTREAKIIALIEKQSEIVKLTKQECAMIELSTTSQGHQSFDLPQKMRRESGANKPRKDSYTTLLLGNWGMKQYKILFDKEENTNVAHYIPKMF